VFDDNINDIIEVIINQSSLFPPEYIYMILIRRFLKLMN